MLQTKDNRITYKSSQISLKGVSVTDVNHIKGFRDFTFEEIVNKALEEFNINTIRIPILPESKHKNSWYDKPNYFEQVLSPAVEYALSKDLFIILDCHYICDFYKKPHFWNRNREWNRNLKHKLMYFWDFLSKQYANNDKIIFEIFNEPIGPDNWHRYKRKLANILIKVIRNNCPNLILIGVPTSCDIKNILEDPIYQKNIAYSTHLYPAFTSSTWKEKYKEVSDKYPLVIVEWGFQEGIIGGDTSYAEDICGFANKNDISLISGFLDTLWPPSLLQNDLSLTPFGQFLKSKR